MEPRKMVQMNRFAGQKLRHRCREQTYGYQRGKAAGGSGGAVVNWEIGIDIYTLICIKWITNKYLLYKKINKIQKKNPQNYAFPLPTESKAKPQLLMLMIYGGQNITKVLIEDRLFWFGVLTLIIGFKVLHTEYFVRTVKIAD